jgi:AcrR family transcriptional regulator
MTRIDPARRQAAAGDAGEGVADRLLATACDLFYREGIHAVGIQRLIEEAGIAKASLYAHYASKDDVVAAYLERRSAMQRAQVDEAFARATTPASRLAALWALVGNWTACDQFRGCPFQNAAGELAAETHPAKAVIASHYEWLRSVLDTLAHQAGAEDPARLGGALLALLNGASARALAERRREPIDDTLWAAEQLLSRPASPKPRGEGGPASRGGRRPGAPTRATRKSTRT